MRDYPKAKVVGLLALTALLLLGSIAAESMTSSPADPVPVAEPAIPTQTGPTVRPPASQNQNEVSSVRVCVTVDGTEFKWGSPNLPWLTLRCY